MGRFSAPASGILPAATTSARLLGIFQDIFHACVHRELRRLLATDSNSIQATLRLAFQKNNVFIVPGERFRPAH